MNLRHLALTFVACAMLTACGDSGWTPPVYSGKQESTEGVPGFKDGKKQSQYVKLGQSYKVMGEWYVPRHEPDYSEVGIASWYGPGFHGGKTANGEEFDKHSMTAAHKTLPLPSIVKVTMVDTGKTIYVRINDRGPFSKGRIIDLSYAAAKEIGLMQRGVAKVRVEYKLAESQRYAELLAQGRRPEDINIAREVLPYAKQTTQYAAAEIKEKTTRPATDPSWWEHVNPVSSAQAATPAAPAKPLYSGSAPDAAPTQPVAARELPPATLPEPIPVPPPVAPTVVNAPPPPAQTASVQQSVFKVMEQQPPVAQSPPPSATSPPPPITPAATSPPAAAPPPPANAPPLTPGSYVQVGTFSVEANASNMASRVKDIGEARISLWKHGDATLYRVRIGPYSNAELAEDVLARVHQIGIADARVITQ